MAAPDNPTYASVAIYYGSDDKLPFVNVLWYSSMVGIDPTDMQNQADSLASAVLGDVLPAYQLVLTTECKVIGAIARVVSAGNAAEGINTTAAGGGDIAGDTLPDYAAAVISKRTVNGTRSGKGRWYIGCVPESFTNTSSLLAAARGAYDDLGLAFRTSVSSGGHEWTAGHYSAKVGHIFDITSTLVRAPLGTQRRRRFRSPI